MPAPRISFYNECAEPRHELLNLGSWIDSQEFSSEDLTKLFSAWSLGRIFFGRGARGAWAVKLCEPLDEDLDPWSPDVPEHALHNRDDNAKALRKLFAQTIAQMADGGFDRRGINFDDFRDFTADYTAAAWLDVYRCYGGSALDDQAHEIESALMGLARAELRS